MHIRQALLSDIHRLLEIRLSVRENQLLDPGSVTEELCADYLTNRGIGWVCDIKNIVAGFAILDMANKEVWALFIHPDFEANGIGSLLHDTMIAYYFEHHESALTLSTEPNTRAHRFYLKKGWKVAGINEKSEVKLTLSHD